MRTRLPSRTWSHQPPSGINLIKPSSVMTCTINPISSMWAGIISLGPSASPSLRQIRLPRLSVSMSHLPSTYPVTSFRTSDSKPGIPSTSVILFRRFSLSIFISFPNYGILKKSKGGLGGLLMSRTQVTSVLVIVCLCAALLTGCSLPHGDGTSAHTTGPLAILGTLESEPATPISEAHIVLSRGKHLIEEIAPVSGTDFTAELQVPIGTWQLTIVLLDALGEAQFQSEPQDVEVYPNNPTAIEVILRPGDGRVDLTIKLDDSPLLKHVRRARVYFNDHRTELIWDDPGEPINHVFTLAPG